MTGFLLPMLVCLAAETALGEKNAAVAFMEIIPIMDSQRSSFKALEEYLKTDGAGEKCNLLDVQLKALNTC